uniref:Ig-like domain-containing protein n=1 Tax=Chrysemys picta bellii TaxID=8478 RepID=A0A8C3IF72_CHRPI
MHKSGEKTPNNPIKSLVKSSALGDSVQSKEPHVTVSEGHDVLLPCNFTTISNTPNLFWYRQYPNHPPQHILTAYKSAAEKNTFTAGKFSTVLIDDNKTVPLKIGAVSLQDRAVYYCALRPTLGQSCISGETRSDRGCSSTLMLSEAVFLPDPFLMIRLFQIVTGSSGREGYPEIAQSGGHSDRATEQSCTKTLPSFPFTGPAPETGVPKAPQSPPGTGTDTALLWVTANYRQGLSQPHILLARKQTSG